MKVKKVVYFSHTICDLEAFRKQNEGVSILWTVQLPLYFYGYLCYKERIQCICLDSKGANGR